MIEITDVSEDGMITYNLNGTEKIEISNQDQNLLESGTFKTDLTIKVIDEEIETFKIGILAKDKETSNNIAEYKFNVASSKGNDKDFIATDSSGKTNELLGGHFGDGEQVTYTISTVSAAPFFKEITPIKVVVYFNENRQIDTTRTLAAQTDSGYGTIWTIEGTNGLVGNDLDIRINIEAYDKLIVELQTIDKITGSEVTTMQYNIPESVNIIATGTNNIEVGYVNPGALTKYSINSVENDIKYKEIIDQEFIIEYDQNTGDIKNTPQIIGEQLEYISHSGKTIKLKIYIEPKEKFTVDIETVNKISGDKIANTMYTIAPSPDIIATESTQVEVGYFELGKENVFTISSNDLGIEYVTPKDQKFKLTFDETTGNILGTPEVIGDSIEYVSHDAVAKILKVKILVEPKVKITVEIETTDIVTNQPVYGNIYSIPESPDIQARGSISMEIGWININTMNDYPTYTLKTIDMTNCVYKYEQPGDQSFKIGIDANGEIAGYQLLGNNLEYVSHNATTIKLKLKLEPKVVFKINNTAHTTGETLQGAKFEITNLETEKLETETTDRDGKAIIYNGIYGKGTDTQEKIMVYKVKQVSSKATYARVEDFYIVLQFNKDRKITKATLGDINGNTINNADNIWVNVTSSILSATQTGYNGNSLGAVIIDVMNYPALRLNFENVDIRNDNTKLKGAKYEIVANTNEETSVTTNELGQDTAYIDYSLTNASVFFTIKQTVTTQGYQTFDDFIIRLYFDSYGFIDSAYVVDKIDDNAQIINLNEIKLNRLNISTNPSLLMERSLDIQLKSTPIFKVIINKTTKDGTPINFAGLTVNAKEENTDKILASYSALTGFGWDKITKTEVKGSVEGQKEYYINKTLINKTMEFSVEEYRNPIGFKKPDEEIKFNLEFDENGKIVPNKMLITSGQRYINITNADSDNFTITIQIINYEIETFGIHLTVQDTYDQSKKLENTNGLGYNVTTFIGNSKYGYRDSSMDTRLIAGRDSDGDGLRDVDYGEDYVTIKKVAIDSSADYGKDINKYVRTIRITPQNAPNIYYQNSTGTQSYYQSISKKIEIEVTFDTEGKVTNAYFKTGKIDEVWYVDNRYIEISFTSYNLSITIKHFPMLEIGVNAVDEYTKEHLAGGSYNLQTYRYQYGGVYNNSSRVSAGYIGDSNSKYYYPTYQKRAYTSVDDNPIVNSICPTEIKNNSTYIENEEPVRYIYIYEMTEPNNYQKYEPRNNTGTSWYSNKYIGYVKVYYNEYGEIDKMRTEISAGQSLDNNSTQNGTYFIKLSENQCDSNFAIQIDIEYKPTTTLKIHVVDDVTKTQLGNVRISPFTSVGTTTSRSYEYRKINYYTSNSSSAQNVKYWGGAVADSNVTYSINTSVIGKMYTEYFFPGQASINVGYDENGKVDSAVPATYDEFGDYNVEVKGWDNNVIDVYILFTRKFNVELIKFDEYDLDIDKTNPLNKDNHRLSATFDFVDEEGIAKSITSNTSTQQHNYTTLGKIQAGKKVKYSLSETGVPSAYKKMDDFDLSIEFQDDGTIKTTSTSSQYEEYKTLAYTSKLIQEKHVDLLAYIYNKPIFTVNLNLKDEFYNNYALEGGTFKIVSSKGDTYEGAAITDSSGNISAIVGTTYAGETVEYTITQTNTLNGYLANNEVATLWVKFDEEGKIGDYALKPAGTLKYYSLPKTNFKEKKNISINVVNTPIDVKFGIKKYDKITNKEMQGVQFKVTKQVASGDIKEYTFITDDNGCKTQKIDEFAKRNEPITVTYTISEISVPGNYRMVEDIIMEVVYLENGKIGDYTIVSNPSNVKIDVAVEEIKYVNNERVHFALTIPNDNTFDLEIKDEDLNYSGLGIEGTSYNVSLNGEPKTQSITDASGKVTYPDITENGRIEIRVSENNVGKGYRENLANDINFIVEKSETEYKISLDENYITYMGYSLISKNLDNVKRIANYEIQVNASNNTVVLLEINEKTGIVSVKFKNETKLELTLTKNDINTGELLSNAQFEILSQVISPVPESIQTITTETNNTTNSEGILYFDIGVAPQNRIVKYTIKELIPPYDANGDQYGDIKDIEMTVKFDSYGKITSIEENSIRATAYIDANEENSRHMKIAIGNGTLKKAFTLKIISEDSITGERINGSTYRVSAQTTNGNVVINDQIVKTDKILDSQGNLIQNGVYVDNNVAETFEGNIIFNIEQDQCTQDYVYGNNVISGTITIKKENVEGNELEAGVALSFDGAGVTGFNANDVTIDKNNNEVIVVIKNDPNASLIIEKFYQEDGEKKPLENVVFDIQEEVNLKTKYNDTKLTDKDGMIKIDLGRPEYDKSIVYTLNEGTIDGFLDMDEIKIKVTYDSKGKIKKYEVLENEELATIEESFELERKEYVINNGQRELQSTSNQTYNTLDGRTTYLSIENVKKYLYNIVITKNTEAEMLQTDGNVINPSQLEEEPYLIQGAEYKITVKEENGEEYSWIETTNDEGKITSKDFEGYGKIEVVIQEISAPNGYMIDNEIKTLTFEKDKKTGIITKEETASKDSELDYEIVENETIQLNPVDAPEMLTMYLHKIDTETNEPITETTATFEAYLEETDGTLNSIGQGVTKKKGVLELNLGNTFDEGLQKIILMETQAPEGYKKISEDIVLNANFRKDSSGNMYLYDISTDNASVTELKCKKTYFSLNVLNQSKKDSEEETKKQYNVEIEKHTTVPGDNTLLEGAKYAIKVIQKDLETIEVNDTTNEEGKIQINELDGTGKIRIELKEEEAPVGYILDTEDKYVEFTRDSETDEFTKIDSNIEYDFVVNPDTGETSVVIKPENNFATYGMYINKVDANTKYRILNNPASFEIYYHNEQEDLIEKIEGGDTDETGLLLLDKLPFATEIGTYTYYIRETVAPAGYNAINYDMPLEIEFKKDDEGKLYIANVNSTDENLIVTVVSKKYFKINVLNSKETSILDYTLILEKHSMIDGDDSLIPGATYRIKVNQEFGEDYDFTETTNEEGIIASDVLTGYGDITIDIEELTAPNGFKIENSVQHIEIRKDRYTGRFSHNSGDLDYEWGEDGTSTVYIKPRDELLEGVFALYINKVDAAIGKKIQNNPAVFQVYSEIEGSYVLQGEYVTNDIGIVRIINSEMPNTPGIYKYMIKEKTAPVNYNLVEDGLEYEIEFDFNDKGEMYIKNVESKSEKLKLDKFDKQYLSLDFLNEREQDKVYTAKITKIDLETEEPILNNQDNVTDITKDDMTAIFRITDEKGNEYYQKSDENGEILFDKLPKPTKIPEGEDYVEIQIKVKEIMAPCGYKLERRESKITLRFKYNDEGRIVLDTSLATVDSDASNIEKYELNPDEIHLYISNEKGDNTGGTGGYIDRGTYSITLNKIDATTEKMILGEAEFEIVLENGERVKAAIKSDGSLEILDIPCPQEVGEYEYVIKEIRAPIGYEINNVPQIFKIAFQEDPIDNTKLVIVNAEETYNQDCVIDVISYENNNVIINMKNNAKSTYKVEHYQRTTDLEVEGYTLVETENIEGSIDKIVTAEPKEYEGFIINLSYKETVQSGRITKDGSLVLKLYYDRNIYNIKYELNEGTATSKLTDKYTYGKELILSNRITKSGYVFSGWYDNSQFNGESINKISSTDTGDKIFYAKWSSSSNYYITSNKYSINDTDKYVTKLNSNTSIDTLKNNISTNGTVKILDKNRQELTNQQLVGTGCILQTTYNGIEHEYQIAVTGDLDGNGKITVTDLAMMNQAIVGRITVNKAYSKAADLDGNGKITVTDLAMMNQAIVGRINI